MTPLIRIILADIFFFKAEKISFSGVKINVVQRGLINILKLILRQMLDDNLLLGDNYKFRDNFFFMQEENYYP